MVLTWSQFRMTWAFVQIFLYFKEFITVVVLTKTRLLQMSVTLMILIAAFTARTLQHTQQNTPPLISGCDLLQQACVEDVFSGVLRLDLVERKVIPDRDFHMELKLPEDVSV